MWNTVVSFLHSINIHKKTKARITREIFETGYIDISFQVANRTEIYFPAKKNYFSENVGLRTDEKQNIPSYWKVITDLHIST